MNTTETQFPSFDDKYAKKAQAKQYVQEVAEKLQVHFYNHNYYLINGDGFYEEYGPAEIRRVLRVGHKIPKKLLDEALYLIDHKRVDWAGPLSGYKAGIHQYGSKTLLVTKGPTFIEGIKGKCPEAQAIIQGVCGDQWPRTVGWIKWARDQIATGAHRPGQVLILCGPKRCGKSTFQNDILPPLFGGRKAHPFQFMTRQTAFNADLFEAEILIIDDEIPHGDPYARKTLSNYMKQVASRTNWRCHPKGLPGLDLPLFARLTVSCNDDDNSIEVLPQISEDLIGKLIVIKAQPFEFQWPNTPDESVEFKEMLAEQMPALAYWIDHFEIPAQIRDRDYGVTGYIEPELRQKIDHIGIEFQLLELARSAVENNKKVSFPCEKSSYDWFNLIREDYNLQEGLLRITQSPDGLGRMFSRLWTNKVKGIAKRISGGKQLYKIDESEPQPDTET